jgi:uncharacterized protein (TIGR03435 family)
MSVARIVALSVLVAAAVEVRAQAPAQPAAPGPTFDVVSIRRAPENPGGPVTIGVTDRPDGGLTATRVLVTTLIGRAYRLEVAGVPDWAAKEQFDVIATANLKGATGEERSAMLKAMLADRFKLLAHVEDREYDTYDLVLARDDGRLGTGLKRIEADCAAVNAERTAARNAAIAAGGPPPEPPRPGPTGPLPPCFLRTYFGRMDGQATLDDLATALRFTTRSQVINKTGLSGSYEIAMEFDPTPIPSGPQVTPPALGDKPSPFTALQEQLGLKLVPSRTARPTLVVDRLERPTEN